ncbi:MAG: antitoxin VapB family protein [Candidatus Freyarchaeota archaeon]
MKTISIRDDVYKRLLDMKGEGESFSDVIEKLLERRFDLKEYFGALKESEILHETEEYSKESRKSARVRL